MQCYHSKRSFWVLALVLISVVFIHRPTLFAQTSVDSKGKELQDEYLQEVWERAKKKVAPTTEWRSMWIGRFEQFAEAHPENRFSSVLLGYAVGMANSMGDRNLASKLSQQIATTSPTPEAKARWIFEEAEVLELSWIESKTEKDRARAISKFQEAANIWGNVRESYQENSEKASMVLASQIYSLYRKGLLLKHSPEDHRNAMAAFQEADSLFKELETPVGKVALTALTREHLLMEAFFLACSLNEKAVAEKLLSDLQIYARQRPPVHYAVHYANALLKGGEGKSYSDFLGKWFHENQDTKDAYLALYHAADHLFASDQREKALQFYRALLRDHTAGLKELEANLAAKGEAGVYGNAIYTRALCERDVGEMQKAVSLLEEFVQRYPNDSQTRHVQALLINTREQIGERVSNLPKGGALIVLLIVMTPLIILGTYVWRRSSEKTSRAASRP